MRTLIQMAESSTSAKGREIALVHEAEARAGVQSQKCEIIREIWARGQQVTKVKLAFFDDEIEALKYEASLIYSLDGPANIVQGRKRLEDILLLQEDATYFGASIRQVGEDGEEFYSACETCDFFGYISWQSFNQALSRAKVAMKTQGINIAVQAARHAASPSRADFDAQPDGLGGWSKSFGTAKELDYHNLLGKIPSEEKKTLS
jgi:hypothetical protein